VSWLQRAEARQERRRNEQRHFAEELPGSAHAQPPLPAGNRLGYFHAAGKQNEERSSVTLTHDPFAGSEMNVGCTRGNAAQEVLVHAGEERCGPNVVLGDHRCRILLVDRSSGVGGALSATPSTTAASLASPRATLLGATLPRRSRGRWRTSADR
jgi:hypothetical protein